MKNIFLILTFAISIVANAQNFFGSPFEMEPEKIVNLPDKPNKVDAQGRKQGEWARKFENGQYAYEAYFVDDKPTKVVRYYPEGMKSVELTYDADGSCWAILYDEEGKKEAEGRYVNEKKEGEWKLFFTDGKILGEQTYKDGNLVGTEKIYYNSGGIQEETNYVDGKKNGVSMRYYPSGKRQCVTFYSGDKEHGDYRFFDEGGKTTVEGKHNLGVQVGTWRLYDAEEEEYFEMKYDDNGKLLNEDEINERMQKQYEKLDAERVKIEDPQHYINRPEEYRP